MRKILATILVVGLVLATFGGLPALGEETEPAQSIGRYERIIDSGELTENHVTQTANGLAVEGPSFTNTLRVDKGFLEAELGAWSASAAFSLDGDRVVFEGRKADFAPLEIGADPVFTLGSRDQVEFQDRPMWVSVEQEEHGGQITLEMEDGDTTGQSVFIGKQWLWDRGIHRPEVVHEDGTNLSVERAPGGDGWMIDVHHFSYVEITATDMVVFSRQDGVIVPHTDETRWYEEEKRLEIDVGNDCASHVILAGLDCASIDQDIMVDKDWLDMRIEHLALETHVWAVESYNLRGVGQENYYEVALTAGQLPTTVVYREFVIEDTWLYSAGSEDTMEFSQPLRVSSALEQWNLTVQYDSPLDASANHTEVWVNGTFAELWDIQYPLVSNQGSPVVWGSGEGGSFSFNITNPDGVFAVEAVWKPIEEFVGLPDPEEWLVDPVSGLHYRRTTEVERQTNDWEIGSYLVEVSDLLSIKNGAQSVDVMIPFNDTLVHVFEAQKVDSKNKTATSAYLNGTTAKTNITIYRYGEIQDNHTFLQFISSDEGGLSGKSAVNDRNAHLTGPRTTWFVEDLQDPESSPDSDELALVENIYNGVYGIVCTPNWGLIGEECPLEDDAIEDPNEGKEHFFFGLYGEMKWCFDRGENWRTDLEWIADDIIDGFSDTDAVLHFGEEFCWYSSSLDDAEACDSGDATCAGPWGQYPFNGCDSDRLCYIDNAWENVDQVRYNLHPGAGGVKLAQVVHAGVMGDYCGAAYSSTSGYDKAGASVTTDRENFAGCTMRFTPTHEFGHNFGADHCKSDPSVPTVMTTTPKAAKDAGCEDNEGSEDLENRENRFSEDNLSLVNSCASHSTCPREDRR